MSLMHNILPWYNQAGYIIVSTNAIIPDDGDATFKYPLSATGTRVASGTIPQSFTGSYANMSALIQPGSGTNVTFQNFECSLSGNHITADNYVATISNNSILIDNIIYPGQFTVDVINNANTDQCLHIITYVQIPEPVVPDGYITLSQDGWYKALPSANYPYMQDITFGTALPVGTVIKWVSGFKDPAASSGGQGGNMIRLWAADSSEFPGIGLAWSDITSDAGATIAAGNINGTPPATNGKLLVYNSTTNPGAVSLAYYLPK